VERVISVKVRGIGGLMRGSKTQVLSLKEEIMNSEICSNLLQLLFEHDSESIYVSLSELARAAKIKGLFAHNYRKI